MTFSTQFTTGCRNRNNRRLNGSAHVPSPAMSKFNECDFDATLAGNERPRSGRRGNPDRTARIGMRVGVTILFRKIMGKHRLATEGAAGSALWYAGGRYKPFPQDEGPAPPRNRAGSRHRA